MTTLLRSVWETLIKRNGNQPPVAPSRLARQPRQVVNPPIEIVPNDPIIPHLQSVGGAVEVDLLNLDSPALRSLRAANVKLVVPLVSQGELIGLLNLGPRLSEQDYSVDDHILLNNLAAQATPAVRVAQLVRQQQAEAQARERMEQELRVARLIQQTLLPKQMPELPGWRMAVHYQPAQAVGGDFYDFAYLADGRLMITVGDVTNKGVPAALVMATTRAILRGTARRQLSPSAALVRANELLCPEIPPSMFVTCLYAILDPITGRLQFANAGHDLPYLRHAGSVVEVRATGMPLGLVPGMRYEEKEITLDPGDGILLYSDGLVEAHNQQREMFSFARLRDLVLDRATSSGAAFIQFLLAELAAFTGPDWEQEDDITLVTLERDASASPPSLPPSGEKKETGKEGQWRTLIEFSLPSQTGNECEAMDQVVAAVRELNLSEAHVQRLGTAVAEATMNSIEHGNKNRPEVPVTIQVRVSETALSVRITDDGGGQSNPQPEVPDLEAKLAGLQSPRGWGLFLIEKMVDEMHVTRDEDHHTIELIIHLQGGQHGSQDT
jgi:serine phosphatase RsbU (regulator of sigma subunit)/anti-sigma regulatory factor (Ser/Thr protein kinase)